MQPRMLLQPTKANNTVWSLMQCTDLWIEGVIFGFLLHGRGSLQQRETQGRHRGEFMSHEGVFPSESVWSPAIEREREWNESGWQQFKTIFVLRCQY